MNSEANFDILYILSNLESVYDLISIQEIQNICYLSLLVSVFDKNPVSEWKYEFTYNNDDPFSYSIMNEVDYMLKNGVLLRENSENYKLTNKAKRTFKFINELRGFEIRKKYLQVATDAVLAIPLPKFMSSMNYEPLIAEKRNFFDRESLGYGISIHKLYGHFKGIREVLGVESHDLWIASVLWLKYLGSIEDEMEAQTE